MSLVSLTEMTFAVCPSDYQYNCDDPWADPPLTCEIYEGQKAGKYNNSIPVENRNGRTDVEGWYSKLP